MWEKEPLVQLLCPWELETENFLPSHHSGRRRLVFLSYFSCLKECLVLPALHLSLGTQAQSLDGRISPYLVSVSVIINMEDDKASSPIVKSVSIEKGYSRIDSTGTFGKLYLPPFNIPEFFSGKKIAKRPALMELSEHCKVNLCLRSAHLTPCKH